MIPVFLHVLGKSLPRGEGLRVPFFCDVFVGAPLPPAADRRACMAELETHVHALADEGRFPTWE